MEQANVWSLCKSVLLAAVFALVGVLIFAAAVKVFELSDPVITLVNQILKTAAILLGCIFGLKGGKRFFKGMAVGACTLLLCYVIFTLLAGEPLLRISLLFELIFGAVVGGISGFLSGTLKK